jgi:predicted amidohydrolase YtcJ
MRLPRAIPLVVCLALVTCDSAITTPDPPALAGSAQISQGAPSLIYHGGTVLTMQVAPGRAKRSAGAIAIHENRVMAIGTDEEILRLAKPWTTVIDLGGATVMPGIVDAHTHLFNDSHRLGLDLEGAQDLAIRRGITTLANLYSPSDFVSEMKAFAADGRLKVRTSLYLTYTDNCGVPQGDWWKAHPPTRERGERLRIGGLKIFADGGTCGEPAVSVEFRAGSGLGDLHLTAEQIATAVSEAEQTGHQVVIHAIGDRGVDAAQAGIEAGLAGRANELRHRIDHNVVVRDDQIARYDEVGIQPVLFGYLPLGVMDPDPATCEGAPRNAFFQAFEGDTRHFLDELPHSRVAWHGDDPWIGPVNPFRELYNMVTRIRRGNTIFCPPQSWQLDTRITAEEGLRMMTTNSAYALFRENEVGSLEPGKLADLLIVDGNPLSSDPDEIFNLELWVTMIDGRVEFCATGREVLCPATGPS